MLINHGARATGKSFLKISAALLIAASMAGCAKDHTITGSLTRSQGKQIDQMSTGELQGAANSLGEAYARSPTDKLTALRYANVLQMNGNSDQSLAVMRKLAIALPKDRSVLAAYGKALAANGQFEPALDAVRRAQTPEYPDWKLLSAEAAILDQLGQAQPARELYRKALDLKPNEPSVLSNLGMSYVLAGDLRTAEEYMRSASQQPDADSRVRQNLALVVGLQGRFPRRSRSPARNCRLTWRRPTSLTCVPCFPNRMPGTSSRTTTRRSKIRQTEPRSQTPLSRS